eukprot:4316115-Lingulodinium_polyedra.AAC.1
MALVTAPAPCAKTRVVSEDPGLGAKAARAKNPGPRKRGHQHHVERAVARDAAAARLHSAQP